MPVIAKELEYREYRIFFGGGGVFPTFPHFPRVESRFPLDAQKKANRRSKPSGAILRDGLLANCAVDMVVLISYYSLAL